MKILFLDFDGVVNSHESFHLNHLARTEERELRGEGMEFAPQFCFPMGHLHPPLIERLNKIMKQTDCHIVVSSAWRIGHSVEQLAEWLTKKGFRFGNKIIDRTGQNSKDARGGEIQDWLDEHPEVTNTLFWMMTLLTLLAITPPRNIPKILCILTECGDCKILVLRRL